jgi:hypothetical protein
VIATGGAERAYAPREASFAIHFSAPTNALRVLQRAVESVLGAI